MRLCLRGCFPGSSQTWHAEGDTHASRANAPSKRTLPSSFLCASPSRLNPPIRSGANLWQRDKVHQGSAFVPLVRWGYPLKLKPEKGSKYWSREPCKAAKRQVKACASDYIVHSDGFRVLGWRLLRAQTCQVQNAHSAFIRAVKHISFYTGSA